MDNVLIERLWRSLKYECVYLNAFDNLCDAAGRIGNSMMYYHLQRPHSSLKDSTPHEVYEEMDLPLAA